MSDRCLHEFTDRLLAVQADGMCPLCMKVEIEGMRAALSGLIAYCERGCPQDEASAFQEAAAAIRKGE